MTVARRDWVVKSNDLINARYDWTALQQRMILLMIAQLEPSDEDFGTQRIDIADLVDRSGLSGKAYYERAAEAAEVLLDQKIFVRTDAGRWRGYNLLSYVEPHPGHINARFNPDMRPFLLQLKRRFTRYILGHVLRFQSPYSVRIYEMAMQFQDIGHRTIPLDDLRETLDVAAKYPRFYDFKRRILDQAVKEIGRHTDHVVTYDVLKEGRTPTAVRLHIRKKTDGETAPGEQTTLNLSSQPAQPYAGVGDETSDDRAFRSWWRARTDADRAALEADARDRLDAYSRKADPSSIVYRTSFREALLEVWREQTAAQAV
ncbi:replication initiation protein [Rubrivirga sp.]|uniref:replication initiation protein n=1 Tax=Rubrivirga sp. TaxID=1885344 RepID=UPI003C7546FE